ncbi:MAG: hypothetical protein LBL77_02895 [Endomicrobium sp.]|jgi:hypothetical protein|nr:hypothetical protein [Endomicrobium sp.]
MEIFKNNVNHLKQLDDLVELRKNIIMLESVVKFARFHFESAKMVITMVFT